MQSLHCEECARKKCKVIPDVQPAMMLSQLLIMKENLFKFRTLCDTEQCEFDGLVVTRLSDMIDD